MKDYANSRLKLKRTVIIAFCYISLSALTLQARFAAFRWDISTTGLGNTFNVVHLKINPTMRTSRAILDFLELSSASAVSGKLI